MILVGVLLLAFALYCWAAIPYLRPKRLSGSIALPNRSRFVTTGGISQRQQRQREFAALAALSGELDLTIFALRQALSRVATLNVEQLDFDSIRLIESRLGHPLPPAGCTSAAILSEAACRLENNLAGCQTVCALIDAGPAEHSHQLGSKTQFVSLLARAKGRLSRVPFTMQYERRVVKAAMSDLATAQLWMETASLVVRRLPLKDRFAQLPIRPS
jgi:hypothetical protein